MILVRDARKTFGSIRAVDGLSLEIRAGEVFGLLGPNGAGKSTTISMMVGLLAPDSGTVTIEGGPPTDAGVRSRLGLAPQSLAIYDELTAAENLRFFGGLYGLRGAALRDRGRELLELAGLADRASHRAGTFSGGMKRRLNLVAALMHNPRVLFLDEPTAGVDPQSRSAIFGIVEAVRARGATVVYTTHYMEEAQRLCDRIAIVDHGKLLALDTLDGLLRSHGGPGMIVIGRDDGEERVPSVDPARQLADLLADGRAREVRLERPSLEAVFLNLTGRQLRDD